MLKRLIMCPVSLSMLVLTIQVEKSFLRNQGGCRMGMSCFVELHCSAFHKLLYSFQSTVNSIALLRRSIYHSLLSVMAQMNALVVMMRPIRFVQVNKNIHVVI